MTCLQIINRDDLILKNQRLVHWVLHRYYGQYDGPLEREDLVQTGLVGLVKAADSFDPDRGPFATHAIQQIRKELQNAVLDADLIQRPREETSPRRVCVSLHPPEDPQDDHEPLDPPGRELDPSQAVEDRDWLDANLACLTPREREAVELTVIQGHSESQAAKIMHISLRRVQQLRQVAFSKLRTSLR